MGLTTLELDFFQGRAPLAPSFSSLEQAVMEYAEQMTVRGKPEHGLTMTLLSALGQPRLLVEVTGVIAIANATCRIENALEVEEDV